MNFYIAIVIKTTQILVIFVTFFAIVIADIYYGRFLYGNAGGLLRW